MERNQLDELKSYFGTLVEHLDGQVRLVAEGVTTLSDRLNRVSQEIKDELRREAGDTRSAFRFSHAELERRLQTLEGALAELARRVDKVETQLAS